MVLSHAAFRLIADNIYGEKCKFDDLNDITLANCFHALGVLMIHSDKFYWENVGNIRDVLYPPLYVNRISFHYMSSFGKAMRMTCDGVVYWRYNDSRVPFECRNHTRNAKYLAYSTP